MATPQFWSKLARRARAAEAAAPAARIASLADEIRSVMYAQGALVDSSGRVLPGYVADYDGLGARLDDLSSAYDDLRLAQERPLDFISVRRPPRPPDMSLDSPLFRDMFQADRSFDQLRKGRTSNLRNSGGELASIASQSIRDAEAAAAAGRTALDRAGGPEGAVMLGVLGGTAAAAPAGMVINNALEARRKQQESELASRRMAEAFAAEQAALREQYLNDIDGFDPVAADVVSPEFDEQLFADLASYRGAIRPTSVRAVEAHTRAQGLPTFPGTVVSDADHAAGEQFAAQEQYLNDMDGLRAPDMLDVVSPEFDSGLLADMASQSYPRRIQPRSVGAIDNYARQQGLPTFPGAILEDEPIARRRPAPHYMPAMGTY